MEGFQAVLGFILGVVIFLIILSKLRVIFMGYYVMIFFFFISLCLGMILAKFLSWLVIILIIIGIIAFIYIKLHSGSPPESDVPDTKRSTPFGVLLFKVHSNPARG